MFGSIDGEKFLHRTKNRYNRRNIHSKGYRISILTKRDRSSVPYVARWLDFHDVYSDNMLFVYDGTPKAEYPFDILIDDAPTNLIDVVSPKSAIFLTSHGTTILIGQLG